MLLSASGPRPACTYGENRRMKPMPSPSRMMLDAGYLTALGRLFSGAPEALTHTPFGVSATSRGDKAFSKLTASLKRLRPSAEVLPDRTPKHIDGYLLFFRKSGSVFGRR